MADKIKNFLVNIDAIGSQEDLFALAEKFVSFTSVLLSNTERTLVIEQREKIRILLKSIKIRIVQILKMLKNIYNNLVPNIQEVIGSTLRIPIPTVELTTINLNNNEITNPVVTNSEETTLVDINPPNVTEEVTSPVNPPTVTKVVSFTVQGDTTTPGETTT